MNFISRHLNTIGILLIFGFSTAAATLYFDVPQKLQQANSPKSAAAAYVCPMHPDVVSDKPAHCSKCGMNLVTKTASLAPQASEGCGHEGSGCCGSKTAAPDSGCNHDGQAGSTEPSTNATK
jgi:hypothetical protein